MDRADDSALVDAVRAGDADAFGALYDRWYDRVFDLARRITHDDGLAADVAQDTFLTAWRKLPELREVPSFGGWLLRIARNGALDLVRSAERTRTMATEPMTATFEEATAADRLADLDDPAVVVGDRELQTLVLGAAEALGERDATALDLQLRYGLEPAEVGEALGINRNAANQLVHRMKGRLETAIRGRVLWRGGQPECAALAEALAAKGIDGFDQQAVSVTNRHAATCDDCGRRQELRLDPAKLFAAVPVVVAPVLLKQKAAAALEAEGVPMSGSAFSKTRRGPRHWVRTAVMAGVGVVILVLAAAVTTAELGDGGLGPPVEQVRVNDVTTTTVEGTFTASIPEPAPESPTPVEEDVVEPDGPSGPAIAPPAGQTPTGSAVTPTSGSISTSGSVPTVVPQGQFPTVTWSTSAADSASVSGPGLSSSALSGSQAVCPGTIVSSVCRSAPGTYTYTLTASGPGGDVQRSATITVA